ncbi:hypothetical protein [Amycolatopsis sp. NPDC049159]|uniref:hypothetical protein n=1 Tax=Amycolatopsis sp. NPDC049159 TaxID=3157210 RepID=UPI0033C43B75
MTSDALNDPFMTSSEPPPPAAGSSRRRGQPTDQHPRGGAPAVMNDPFMTSGALNDPFMTSREPPPPPHPAAADPRRLDPLDRD